jgi:ParB/RepB/Spo0J family partition protein
LESIERDGLQQPMKVRPISKKKYQAIFGDGRLEAAKALHMKTIPVIIEKCSEEEALIKHGVENLCRNDWSEVEQGEYFALVIKQTGMTYREMERFFQVSRSLISERIALYEKLTPKAKKAVAKRKISASAVEYALHKLPEKHALQAIETAVENNLDLDGVITHVNAIKPTVEVHEKAKALPSHSSPELREQPPNSKPEPESRSTEQFKGSGSKNNSAKPRTEDVSFTLEVNRSKVVRDSSGLLIVQDSENHRDRNLLDEFRRAWLKLREGDLVEFLFRHTTSVNGAYNVSSRERETTQ